jgi:hypothetical protein
VSSGSYLFNELDAYTTYKIIVIAKNSEGFSVKQIIQSTDGIPPVLNDISIDTVDSTSITINQPTFSTTGNPTPTVKAYIGLDGTISVSGNIVSNSIEGPVDVSSGNYSFNGLDVYTTYKIIVIGENVQGYSIKQISQSTDGIAPVLNIISFDTVDSTSITLDQPTFSTTGNPTPTVKAYIGLDGTISISGNIISNSTEGPIDVSSGNYQFQNLNPDNTYRIIVIAENIQGYDVQMKLKITDNFYIAGYTRNSSGIAVPCYWKNGIRTDLPVLDSSKDSEASSIDVSGTDIYIAGFATNSSGFEIPCYWKNGTLTELSTLDGSQFGRANAMLISGTDVYIAGETSNSSFVSVPCYWKNGTRTDLSVLDSSTDSYAGSIYVSGTDVYIAGETWNSSFIGVPCYWKNGTRTDLSVLDSSIGSYAYSIYVSGTDVYVAGETGNSSFVGVACYWKNGARTDLPVLDSSKYSNAGSIYVSGTDVYIAGDTMNSSSISIPCYWKNGTRTDLSVLDNSKEDNYASSIFVSGSDIYVSGATQNSSSISVSCYWKNGTRSDLPVLDNSKASGARSIILY